MAEQLSAKAFPHKSFFVDMFTRDLTLVECILDLIDNSIDGVIRTRDLKLDQNLLTPPNDRTVPDLPTVRLDVSDKAVVISDNCGGIPIKDAQEEVFNFGHSPEFSSKKRKDSLGVYGVGLKRALFKIGKAFEVTSRTVNDGFSIKVDLDEWMHQDSMQDWTFPLVRGEKAKSRQSAGTTIKITRLREDVRAAINDGTFRSRLFNEVGRVYALFLERYVCVQLGLETIKPMQFPLGSSDEVTPAYKELKYDGVNVFLFASLAKRDARSQWPADQAGWYVACNGRLVVAHDKTELTGWGVALPEFHGGKYRGFVGLALFTSDDPLKLPWTTRKSGLNRESMAFQQVRHQMVAVTKPILSFLNKMYPSDPPEEPKQRAIADNVRFVDVRSLHKGVQSDFDIRPKKPSPRKTTVRIVYDAERDDIEKVKKHLRRPDLSPRAVGEVTFAEYLRGNGLK